MRSSAISKAKFLLPNHVTFSADTTLKSNAASGYQARCFETIDTCSDKLVAWLAKKLLIKPIRVVNQ